MAEPLLRSSAVFLDAVRKCADALKPHGVDLMAEFGKEDGWKHPALAMVGLVAVQVNLAAESALQTLNCREGISHAEWLDWAGCQCMQGNHIEGNAWVCSHTSSCSAHASDGCMTIWAVHKPALQISPAERRWRRILCAQ